MAAAEVVALLTPAKEVAGATVVVAGVMMAAGATGAAPGVMAVVVSLGIGEAPIHIDQPPRLTAAFFIA